MIHDLNTAVAPCDVVKYTINGKDYIIPLEVSDATAIWLADHLEDIRAIFDANGKPRLTRDTIDLAIKLVVQLFRENYPEIDAAWVERNLNFRMKLYIIVKAAVPLINFVTNMTKDFAEQFAIHA